MNIFSTHSMESEALDDVRVMRAYAYNVTEAHWAPEGHPCAACDQPYPCEQSTWARRYLDAERAS